jgi:RimJ/RimL family protein N-acetyltransferase
VALNRPNILLRDVRDEDLPVFFEQQLDRDANDMAAFTARNPQDRDAFMAHWSRILGDERIIKKSIVVDGRLAGHVLSFEQFGEREVSYWIGKEYWGRGIATKALTLFLEELKVRPLYARAAKDNVASLRVLAKCGFKVVGEDRGYANARGAEIEEYVLKLEPTAGSAHC